MRPRCPNVHGAAAAGEGIRHSRSAVAGNATSDVCAQRGPMVGMTIMKKWLNVLVILTFASTGLRTAERIERGTAIDCRRRQETDRRQKWAQILRRQEVRAPAQARRRCASTGTDMGSDTPPRRRRRLHERDHQSQRDSRNVGLLDERLGSSGGADATGPGSTGSGSGCAAGTGSGAVGSRGGAGGSGDAGGAGGGGGK